MICGTFLPKVLVLGQRFHSFGGGGITQSNLFKDWDPDSLYSLPLQSGDSEYDVCQNVFELSAKNRRFFGFIKTSVTTGNADMNAENSQKSSNCFEVKSNPKKQLKNRLIGVLNGILRITGLMHVKYTYTLDQDLIDWLKQADIDLVYAQYSTLSGMLFIYRIVKHLKKPLIIHIMDDWIEIPYQKTNYSWIWRKTYKYFFVKLISRAHGRIAISESMANEYEKRYSYKFEYLNNPVDPNKYVFERVKVVQSQNSLRIGYFGRIGRGNQDTIRFVMETIQNTNHRLDIYRGDNTNSSDNKHTNVNYCRRIEHSNIPQVMSKYDLLLLPLDFDPDSIRFVKYSMPTKMGEYLMTGVPILLIAPPETAVYTYLKDNDAAFILDKHDRSELLNLLDEILFDSSNTERISKNAKLAAHKDFSKDVIINRFRNILCRAASNE